MITKNHTSTTPITDAAHTVDVKGLPYVPKYVLSNLEWELTKVKSEACRPTFQCSECGSTGPFNDIVHPSSPNGPEEHDIECEECGSLSIAESPREAFRTFEDKLEREHCAVIGKVMKSLQEAIKYLQGDSTADSTASSILALRKLEKLFHSL